MLEATERLQQMFWRAAEKAHMCDLSLPTLTSKKSCGKALSSCLVRSCISKTILKQDPLNLQ